MIRKETVYVLGAGASMPYGFPSGRQLVDRILELHTDGRTPATKHLLELGFTLDDIRNFQLTLRKSQQDSVDAFLEHRTEFIPLGKLVIAQQLLPCEGKSLEVSPLHGEASWYRMLLNKALDAGGIEQFTSNKIAFVTFNYDRSLEQFLYVSLSSRYGVSENDVATSLATIPIIHVHGRLGPLPWQDLVSDHHIEYGASVTPDAIKHAADGIKIISEIGDVDMSPEFQRARQRLASAEHIYFLGFGFHPDNVFRLDIPFTDKNGRWPHGKERMIVATCFGETETQARVWGQRYGGLSFGNVNHKIDRFLAHDQHFLSNWR